jgi:formylglycine-generating enzyme required for sulfatase activity
MGNNPSWHRSCGGDCPLELVNWWEALAYANALSRAEGLPECYELSGCSGEPGDPMVCSDVTIRSNDGTVYDCEGYRLPTEAEWEYAARAGTELLYAGSDAARDVAWNVFVADYTPHPVATKQPNGWGLYDMSGNVREWVQDWFDGSYYASSVATDPTGPSSGDWPTQRGGGWLDLLSDIRVSTRAAGLASVRCDDLGFRLVRTIH